jgi:tetratricopeptide (TPR) repeat protein
MSKRSVAASRSGRSTGDGRRSTGTGRKAEPAAEQRSTRTTKRRIRGLAAFLVAAGLIVYGNSLWGVFIFDDQNSILGNPQIRRLWPLWNAFSAPANTPVAGRPVVALSLAVNYAFGGLDVRGYHAWNVGVHILCALVLFGIIRRTLGRSPLRERFGSAADGIAAACALIWMVHPLQTEAVNYVTQRTESTMALFYLLTLYAAIRALDAGRPASWHGVAVLCCALGMASKEVMVTAPLMVLLYDVVFRSGPFRPIFEKRWPLYLGLAATWAILLALTWSGPRARTAGFSGGGSAWDYALNQSIMVTRYLRLAVWPNALVLDYGAPQPTSVLQVWPYLVVVTLIVVATAMALVYRPAIGFPGAWFFLILAPTSSVIPIATEVGAERRMYLPLAAVVVLSVSCGWIWLRHRSRAVPALLLVGVAGSLGLMSAWRNTEYRSDEVLWRTVVERRPHWRAYSNLGEALQRAGRRSEAIEQHREALRLNPEAPEALYNLALDLERNGDLDESIGHYKDYLRLRSDDGPAHNQLGVALAKRGKMEEAIAEYREALRLDPELAEAHRNLGTSLLQQEKAGEAAEHFERFLALRPDDPDVHNSLGVTLAMQNKLDEAALHYARAVQIDPENTDAQMNLGRVLIVMGRTAEAGEHFREAVRLKPALRDAVADAMSRVPAARPPSRRP